MKSEDITKELWSLANIITGFSVAQSITVTIALGKDLDELQLKTVCVKLAIAMIALIFAAMYCFAVRRCWVLAGLVDSEHETIWRQVTRGRQLCIVIFTSVFVFGLFAPEIFHKTKCVQSLTVPQSTAAPHRVKRQTWPAGTLRVEARSWER